MATPITTPAIPSASRANQRLSAPSTLANIETLVAAAGQSRQPPQPLETEVAAFGDSAALFGIAQRLDLIQLLDSTLPHKPRQGISPGQYLLLAAINRAVSPTSKLQFADWYKQTALTRLLPADPAVLSSQNFWNHMDRITADHVLDCEKQITQRLIQRFQLDLRSLVYDGTNFFTYINTRTPAELPQRGHNKQKRNDLRQVNLGPMVSADFHIPLFHKVYAGNINDSTEFRTITLVFDKGNNSEETFASLESTALHFVESLGVCRR